MKLLGNSVAVDAVHAVAQSIIEHLNSQGKHSSLRINVRSGEFELVY